MFQESSESRSGLRGGRVSLVTGEGYRTRFSPVCVVTDPHTRLQDNRRNKGPRGSEVNLGSLTRSTTVVTLPGSQRLFGSPTSGHRLDVVEGSLSWDPVPLRGALGPFRTGACRLLCLRGRITSRAFQRDIRSSARAVGFLQCARGETRTGTTQIRGGGSTGRRPCLETTPVADRDVLPPPPHGPSYTVQTHITTVKSSVSGPGPALSKPPQSPRST